MFRAMRRIRQQLSSEETIEALEKGEYGVLAVSGDDGYPYAVPVNYVYSDGKILFHSALEGHKIDAIASCPKVSFCVTARDMVVPEEYTTYFRSVIAFGQARIIEEEDEKMHALRLLGDRFNPGHDDALEAEIAKGFSRLHMVAIDIEHVTGKQAIELTAKGQE